MTSLNKSITNSPDLYTSSLFEYWQLLESSVYTQQAETGSYDPIKVVTSKEANPIARNFTIQISPGSSLLLITFITLIYISKLKEPLFIPN